MASMALSTYTCDVGVLGRKKTELQANGVKIAAELFDELEKEWNAPAVRNGRFVFCLESPDDGTLTTVLIINGKFVAKSPFRMVRGDSGKFEVWKGDEKYTDIVLLPRPKFYDKLTSDGVPMSSIAVIGEPDHLRTVLNQRCAYQQMGKPCKFCAIETWWAGYTEKSPFQVAEVAEAEAETPTDKPKRKRKAKELVAVA